ncbi:hypothetical protein CVT26_003961 [Gymnopilus dilepis]|uniref:Uncharacterized protein n=1 Tax=Gymnopilus dilepis TaxID=231916 RepID=A0A409WKI4_9AGAR|nr:hypothetical protein CVT26_003961 [Gymnopilus dilepis]
MDLFFKNQYIDKAPDSTSARARTDFYTTWMLIAKHDCVHHKAKSIAPLNGSMNRCLKELILKIGNSLLDYETPSIGPLR